MEDKLKGPSDFLNLKAKIDTSFKITLPEEIQPKDTLLDLTRLVILVILKKVFLDASTEIETGYVHLKDDISDTGTDKWLKSCSVSALSENKDQFSEVGKKPTQGIKTTIMRKHCMLKKKY